MATAVAPAQETMVQTRPSAAWSWAPWLLALFFAVWSMRTVGTNNIVDTDAARHAMNGAFVRDLVASGQVTHPIQYGKYYYGHLPALSLPFHPPLFPAIESVFFWIFGVNLFAARLAVALATAASAILLFRLIVGTHQAPWLALCVTSTFCLWREAQVVSADVMLEFPAMAFTLGALTCLKSMIGENGRWRWLLFALLAGCAVWTKQHALFLGAAPFLYAVLVGQWKSLLRWRLWVALVLLGMQVIALSALAIPFRGTGVDQVSIVYDTGNIFVRNVTYYASFLRSTIGLIPTIFLAGAVAAAFFGPGRKRNALYLAWGVSAFGLLLLIVPFSGRYLFFTLPAIILIAYETLARLAGRIVGARYAWCAPAAAALVCSVAGLRTPPVFLRGPAQAADALVDGAPRRVLYCGSTDGNFTFETRARDPRINTIVISGDKLPAAELKPAQFDEFARRYGLNDIVLEQSSRAQACDALAAAPTAAMALVREIPLESSEPRWTGGKLKLYRYAAAAADPERNLKMKIPKLGGDVEVRF
jgi:hypothetical protein